MKTSTKTQKNEKKVYILFADLKEYSANKHDLDLILKMETVLYNIGSRLFPENKHSFKVLGDGMLATDKNAVVLSQKALEIVDEIESVFANDDSFKAKPKIRIALHVADKENISERYLTYELGAETLTIFKDIAGEEVINTARIEPIVKPNYVFCSDKFAQELANLSDMGMNDDFTTAKLDTYKLGKTHDSFEVTLSVVHHKGRNINVDELKAHVDEKLGKREETYQDASPLAGSYINQGTQITGNNNNIITGDNNTTVTGDNNKVGNKNTVEGVTIGNIGGDFNIGDKNNTNQNVNNSTKEQNAEQITNIEEMNNATFNFTKKK